MPDSANLQQSENVFDESGQTIAITDSNLADAGKLTNTAEPPNTNESPKKYRIGDMEFATQQEALAYAQAMESNRQVSDAYQRGLSDATTQLQVPPNNVTPDGQSDIDADEFYANPKSFLEKFATKIKTETRRELDQKDAIRESSNQIWREFVDRHPILSDFRTEVEDFVTRNQADVKALIATKGRQPAYDYVATHLKAQFNKYATAIKPNRELSNLPVNMLAGLSSPNNVTPKKEAAPPLSFSQQLQKIRKRG